MMRHAWSCAKPSNESHPMKVDGKPYRTIWLGAGGTTVQVIDQTLLPHKFVVRDFHTMQDAERAIRTMVVRGAPLIGAAAAYGVALAMTADPSDANLARAYDVLLAARPTAVNLRWALDDLRALLSPLPPTKRREAAYKRAAEICDEDAEICRRIGENGLGLIHKLPPRDGKRLNALTHCNAGWLATVDWGTALAPIYQAHNAGIPIHVWVDETRPRNQGASLTAWELGKHGVPHTVIADNAGGHLMQLGKVDFCIVGTDRTTRSGDVCNKIGTYLKALAAHDNGVPFYVGLPYPTIDWTISDGVRDIPIEERSAREVSHMTGRTEQGGIETVMILPEGSPAANPAFDVTPARLVTALITERGVCAASEAGLLSLYPEQAKAA
jgi:methylthioribose-1-phosphate isomerase